MASKKLIKNPISRTELKRDAEKAWKNAENNLRRGKGEGYGMGRIGRANWFAGYAACLDWLVQMLSGTREYTHHDKTGMLWRFEGSRPVSILADIVTDTKIKKRGNNEQRLRSRSKDRKRSKL